MVALIVLYVLSGQPGFIAVAPMISPPVAGKWWRPSIRSGGTMTTTIETAIPAETEAQLRAVLDRAYAGWQAGDADAFIRDYTPDAISLANGVLGETRDAVRARMVDRF